MNSEHFIRSLIGKFCVSHGQLKKLWSSHHARNQCICWWQLQATSWHFLQQSHWRSLGWTAAVSTSLGSIIVEPFANPMMCLSLTQNVWSGPLERKLKTKQSCTLLWCASNFVYQYNTRVYTFFKRMISAQGPMNESSWVAVAREEMEADKSGFWTKRNSYMAFCRLDLMCRVALKKQNLKITDVLPHSPLGLVLPLAPRRLAPNLRVALQTWPSPSNLRDSSADKAARER